MFRLIRTTPEGVEKSGPPAPKLRDVCVQAAYVLHDNARVSKADAQRFGATLGRAPLGDTVRHEPSGYAFRIERVTR